MKRKNKHKTQIRLPNHVLPMSVQRELWAERVQREVNRLLAADRLFSRNHRALPNSLESFWPVKVLDAGHKLDCKRFQVNARK